MDSDVRAAIERQEDYQQNRFDTLFREMKERAPVGLAKIATSILGKDAANFRYSDLTEVQQTKFLRELEEMKVRHDVYDATPDKPSDTVFRNGR